MVTQPYFAAPQPQYVPLSDPLVRAIRTRSIALGVVVLLYSLGAIPTLVLTPYSLVPYADPMRMGVPLFAGMTGFSLVGAGVFTLVGRACVATGYLAVKIMRAVRAALLLFVVLSAVSSLIAWGLLALITSTSPERYRDDVRFGTGELLYVLLLLGAVALIWTCFFALRPVLWRSQYVAKDWTRWGS